MKYGFVVEATLRLGLEVEADSLEEAIVKAREARTFTLGEAPDESAFWSCSEEPSIDMLSAELDEVYEEHRCLDGPPLEYARSQWEASGGRGGHHG